MPGREIVERHTKACMDAGLGIEGTNAEVMMGQWEFQIGILPPPPSATSSGRPAGSSSGSPRTSASSPPSSPSRSSATGTAPGAHTNFSTKAMRAEGGWDAIIAGCEALGKNVDEHVENYGVGIAID